MEAHGDMVVGDAGSVDIGLFMDQAADRAEHALTILTGAPVTTHLVESFKKDLDRGGSVA